MQDRVLSGYNGGGFVNLTPAKYWSRALAISNKGIIVGNYIEASGQPQRAFVCHNDQALTFRDLWDATNYQQRSGWEFVSAQAINDGGWIVGLGRKNGNSRAFLLQPR